MNHVVVVLSTHLFAIIITNYGICNTQAMYVAQQSVQPFLIELICIYYSCTADEENRVNCTSFNGLLNTIK
jgi:hypothetical protein